MGRSKSSGSPFIIDSAYGNRAIENLLPLLKGMYDVQGIEPTELGGEANSELSIDLKAVFKDRKENWAVKIRRENYYSFGDVTIEVWNGDGRQGDWFKFRGGSVAKYVYGWARIEKKDLLFSFNTADETKKELNQYRVSEKLENKLLGEGHLLAENYQISKRKEGWLIENDGNIFIFQEKGNRVYKGEVVPFEFYSLKAQRLAEIPVKEYNDYLSQSYDLKKKINGKKIKCKRNAKHGGALFTAIGKEILEEKYPETIDKHYL